MVRLVDFDPDGEVKLLAAMLYPYVDLPEERIAERVERLLDRASASSWSAPTRATGATAATSPVGRSSAPGTASTCSPTTARSATCSATGC